MRLSWLAAFGLLAIDVGQGGSLPTEDAPDRVVFADLDPASVWSAQKFKQLEARISRFPSHVPSHPFLLTVRDEQLPPRLQKITEIDLRKAREIVEKAVEKAAILNRKRLDNPQRNQYKLQDGTKVYRRDGSEEETSPLLTITDEIADAAALVAEAEAFGENLGVNNTVASNGTLHENRQDRGFWLEQMQHQGSWPWGKNPSDFKVFRNVKDYGAKGDGKTDDTKAIRKAIEESGMCGDGCYSSTTHGAIIYFPAGTYLVSSTIEKHYGTQLIGNPNIPPVMKASKFFVGLGIFSTNKYYGDNQEDEAKQNHSWYINTGIFWGQIRNFVIDISGTYKKVMMTGLHYQVSQATSLQFVEFRASTDADAEQRSIFAENGSGGHMADLTFIGGKYGIYGGNQQFTGQRITFTNVRTAVQLIWDWGWTWKSIVVDGSSTAFNLISEDGSHGIGGALIADSVIRNTKTAVAMYSPTKELGKGTTGLTLNNLKLENVDVLIDEMDEGSTATSVRTTPVDGGKKDIDLWVLGRSYQNNTLGTDLIRETATYRLPGLTDKRNPLGLAKDPYFERAKPQYEGLTADDFVSAKSAGCKGDGNSDDTACLQLLLHSANMDRKVVFIDAGTYMLTDTIVVPSGSRIVGENWAQIAATGPNFSDESRPRTVIRVGNSGDVGSVEMQDLIITSKGETPGAVFIEWNIEADDPGSAAMWEVHVRVGGTDGSGLTSATCPPSRSGVSPGCKGGSMMMHLTETGSAYIENAWYWVADHDLDDPTWEDNNNKMTQTSVYVARGLLAESTKPSWLYGTSSEHSVFYQYQFFEAANLLAGMIQSEQPYYQPTPAAPSPFEGSLGAFRGDPDFVCSEQQPCDSGWGLRVVDSTDITVLGAGLYSWFSTYSQDCLATSNCQNTMAELVRNRGPIAIHNLVTIGAVNMLQSDKELITAKDNQAVDFHPFWSQVSSFEARVFKQPTTSEPIVEHGDGMDPLEAIKADLSEACSMLNTCIPLAPGDLMCGSGRSFVGWDSENCFGGMIRPICCKTSVAPKQCKWRANVGGTATDCDARCDTGEVPLYYSGTGGGKDMDSGTSCSRGQKAFCCQHPGFSSLMNGCEWVSKTPGCATQSLCSSGTTPIAERVIGGSGAQICPQMQELCCPSDRIQFNNCHWVGQEDCADVSCNSKEITVSTNQYGDSGRPCNFSRQKSLCCTPDSKPVIPDRVCARDRCEAMPWECSADTWAQDDGDDVRDDDELWPEIFTRAFNDDDPDGRGGDHHRQFYADDRNATMRKIFLYAATYNGPVTSYRDRGGKRYWPDAFKLAVGAGGGGCNSILGFNIAGTLSSLPRPPKGVKDNRYEEYQMDHVIDLQYLRDFVHTLLWGQLSNGDFTRTSPIPYEVLEPLWNWNRNGLPLGMKRVTPWAPTKPTQNRALSMQNINNRLAQIFGTTSNRDPFRLLSANLNNIKGRVFQTTYERNEDNDPFRIRGTITGRGEPIGVGTMETARNSLLQDQGPITGNRFIQNLDDVLGVWRYVHEPRVAPRIQQVRQALRNELWEIQKASYDQGTRLVGLVNLFDEFDPNWWQAAADSTIEFITRWVMDMRIRLAVAPGTGHSQMAFIEVELQRIMKDMKDFVKAPDRN